MTILGLTAMSYIYIGTLALFFYNLDVDWNINACIGTICSIPIVSLLFVVLHNKLKKFEEIVGPRSRTGRYLLTLMFCVPFTPLLFITFVDDSKGALYFVITILGV